MEQNSVAPLKITIKKWSAVAEWKWNVADEDCGICRCPFNGCPPKIKFPGEDCPPCMPLFKLFSV
jgi:anaphase-promoting complex subunit 11